MNSDVNQQFNVKNYGWSRFIPWSKEAKRYKRDYEKDLLKDATQSQLIRYKQGKTIYSTDTLLFFMITSLWTMLPQFIDFEGIWSWINIGMHKSKEGWDWAQSLMFAIVPASSSTIIHKGPKIIPSKKVSIIIDCILKILPILILLICLYLIFTEKDFKKFKKIEKENLLNKVIGLNST